MDINEQPIQQTIASSEPNISQSEVGFSLTALWTRFINSKWSKKIGGAVLDQALFAGANFVINILLARWMSNNEYGAFVVVYTWFILVQNFYDAVLSEPLSIFGSGKYSAFFKQYLGFIYYGHIGVSLIISLIFIGGALISHFSNSSLITDALIAAAVASPFLLTRWLTRPPFYILGMPYLSSLGGLIYLVLSAASFYFLQQQSLLNPVTALMAIGFSGFIASFILSNIWLKPEFNIKNSELNAREIFHEHIAYSRWSIFDRLMNWLLGNTYYIILPVILTLAESGALRATMNLTLPVIMSLMSVTDILLPNFVRTYNNSGKEGLNKQIILVMKLICGFTIAYFVFTIIFGRVVLSFIYDARFDSYLTPAFIISIALIPIHTGIKFVLDAALKATGKVEFTFKSKIIPVIVTLVGIIFLPQFGILGANIGVLLAGVVTVVLMVRYYRIDETIEPIPE